MAAFSFRNATPGDEERGYSEAAFGVSGQGWYPVHIHANDLEAAVVDLEPDEDIRAALPGMDDTEQVPEEVQQIRGWLLEKYGEDVEIDVAPEQLVPEVRIPTEGDEDDEYRVDQATLRASGPNLDEALATVVDDADLDEEALPERVAAALVDDDGDGADEDGSGGEDTADEPAQTDETTTEAQTED